MEENKKITPWKIIKWMFMLTSLLVYLLVFTRLFVACDADISDDIILTSVEKEAFENLDTDYPLYSCQPMSWTNEEGTIQIKNIYYIEPISELQLTVRYRISEFDKDTTTPFVFKIRVVEDDSQLETDGELYEADLSGKTLEGTEYYSESRFDYKYVRLCTPGVTIDDGESVTERIQLVDEDGNVSYTTKTTVEGGNRIYLDIYDSETEELLYSFVVAGKTVGENRVRRSKVDVRIVD